VFDPGLNFSEVLIGASFGAESVADLTRGLFYLPKYHDLRRPRYLDKTTFAVKRANRKHQVPFKGFRQGEAT